MVKYQSLLVAATLPPLIYLVYQGLKRKITNRQIKKDNVCKNQEFHLMQQALQLQLTGQNEEAVKMFDEIIKQNDKDYLVYYLKGESLTSLQKYDEAVKNYKLALEKEKSKEVYLGLGNAYQKQGKFKEAIEMYDLCSDLDPRFKTSYFNKGITYQFLQDFDNSLKNFDKAIELGLKEAYIHKGLVLQKIGRAEESIAVYDELIRKYNDVPQYYQYKGIALVQLEKIREAIECFDKIIELDSNSEDAYVRKESLLGMLEDEGREELIEFQKIMEKKSIQPRVEV